ncbi:DEAD/DEAH box helicase [Xylocopilactobacillus apicola]|uniref:DNA/RNA helicase n=1 Tax=Xylocopilactobacillus apicola TaxID=2932184 RepID=A0AAU9D900_9LACO|nr:helicase-related protein [Xylocopilactobacillus apicola]BDR57940.1 DNA/RNA helicase [Xylocopilactobacillus apicola]
MRCNTHFSKNDVELPDRSYYCSNCIALGRVTSSDFLYHLPEPHWFEQVSNPLVFEGQLTDLQNKLAQQVIDVINTHQSLLLWAVTGAGKTEMMFPGLNSAFNKGLRVCWATPRVDVVMELAPRLKKVFPTVSLAVLYGEMTAPYTYTQFVICTTHQLWRFYEAFDVLIIDEVDSFPYTGDVSLEFGADQAVNKESSRIYLSATPADELTKKVKVAYLPQRFHGHPLPVPKTVYLEWRPKLTRNQLARKLKKEIAKGLRNHERYLIFVSEIRLLPKFVKAFQRDFPNVTCQAVAASDPKRMQKVQDFRSGETTVLFTTTILERGVTIFHINVLVVGAESRVFNWSSLVQIAGRAGRAADHYEDRVIFYFSAYTKEIKKAVRQIKHLNHLAGFDD